MSARSNTPKVSDSPSLKTLPNMPTPPRMAYSKKETADMLGISKISLERLEARGLIKSSKALRHKMYPLTEIERFLKATI